MMAERSYTPPSRLGKVAVTFYVSPECRHQLKLMALQGDTSIQDIIEKAVDKEMKKRLDKNK